MYNFKINFNEENEVLTNQISTMFLLGNHFTKGGPYICSTIFSRCFLPNTNNLEIEFEIQKDVLRDAIENFLSLKIPFYDEELILRIPKLAAMCAEYISGGKESISNFDLKSPIDKVSLEYLEEEYYNDDTEEWELKFVIENLDCYIGNKKYNFTDNLEYDYPTYEDMIFAIEIATGILRDSYEFI